MRQVIYVDVLVSVNLFINYFILVAVSRFFYIKISKIRILAGAALGAVYSLYILLPSGNFALSSIIKLLMAVTVVMLSFGCVEAMLCTKLILCFYLISFIFSGIMFALWCSFEPMGMVVNNGVVYFNISPVVLVISTMISYAAIEIITKIIGKKRDESTFYNIKIKIFGKEVFEVRAKVDTGHSITEPFSGLPVVILSGSAVKNVIPANLLDITIGYGGESKEDTNLKIKNKIRIIPFSSVLGQGVMPAFKAEYVSVCDMGISTKKEAYIGVSRDNFANTEFDALISPELLE